MELLFRVAALCITAAAFGLLLKKDVPALQLLLVLGTAVVLLRSSLEMAGDVSALMKDFSSATGIAADYLALILKCTAIAATVRLGGDICRDAGQSALATLMEITGTLSAALLSVPLMRVLLENVLRVL